VTDILILTNRGEKESGYDAGDRDNRRGAAGRECEPSDHGEWGWPESPPSAKVATGSRKAFCACVGCQPDRVVTPMGRDVPGRAKLSGLINPCDISAAA
jgi:hypothetical protein